MKKRNVDSMPTEEKQEITLKETNKKGIIITVCMAVALVIGLFFTYSKLLNSKNIFVKSVNKGYAKFEKQIDKYYTNTKLEKTVLMSSDIKFSVDADKNLLDEESKKAFEEFAKLKLSEKIGIDPKTNEMLMNFRYAYGNEDIFNIGAYMKDEKMYLGLKNIYDKYIEYPMSTSNVNSSKIDKDELKYFLSKTKDALINNMNKKDFKQQSEKIKNGKKTIKVTKITYGLSEKSATELMIKFYEEISKDSKYIKILSKMSDTKESEIKKSLKQVVIEMKSVVKDELLDKEVKVRFGVLVKGITKKHVGFIFETADKAKLVYYKNGDNKEFRLSKEDEDLIRASVNGDKTVVTFISNGQELELTINKKVSGNKTTYDYVLSSNGVSLNGKVVMEKVKENKDGTGEVKLSADLSMMGLITFKVEGNLKVEYVDKLDIPNITNTIKYGELTDKDYEKINNALSNSKALQSLTKTLGGE